MNVKKFVIQRFASYLLGGEVFDRLKAIVTRQDGQAANGETKRQMAIQEAKAIGIVLGGFLLNLGVELAVAYLRGLAEEKA